MPEALIPFCFPLTASRFRDGISDPQVLETLGRAGSRLLLGPRPSPSHAPRHATPLATPRPSGLRACLGTLEHVAE